ncbi:MAG TPA: hypothetical protein VFE38_07540 [Edaphobacter sp.]|nr:hypothetical protein [Edaphobacter sp.]
MTSQRFYEISFAHGEISEAQDIVDAVMYLIEAQYVTGEVLHMDARAHVGRW